MLKFTCVKYDKNGDEIPNSRCGEIDWIHIDLYHYFDREGEGRFISLKNDGTFFLDKENEKYFPAHWNKDYVLDFVRKRSQNGSKIDLGSCPKCGKDVDI
jgi:hypothetical protein